MDPADLAADAAELRRLEECAREPIRTPGMVQSHGTLLGVDPESGRVVLASGDAERLLTRAVVEIGGDDLAYAVRTPNPIDPIRIPWGDGEADASVHRADGLAIVELEPVVPNLEYARTGVVTAIQRLSQVTSVDELRTVAAAEIRRITGYDRVMVYRFHDDGHGEVVADERAGDMEPYLGLHFPSSDIPPQARQLYLTKISRQIASTEDAGVPLVALEHDPKAFDLSHAELRSVSPSHLQYMRNMGQRSTVSFSLVEQGRLTGMITCAHRTERRLPILLRRALEVLSQQVALQLSSLGEIDRLRHTVQVRERRAALLAPLYVSDDIGGVLLGGERTVLDLVPADGVILRLDGATRSAGVVPPLPKIDTLLERVGDEPFASECLERDRPDLAHLLVGVAGLLVVPLGDGAGSLVFLRGEVAREVAWLGDPGETNRPDGLSPRTSFSAWRRSVSGRSLPWGTVVGEAAELGRDLEGALRRRTESRLAELAMRDPLTGLHNRRHLVERLDAVIPTALEATGPATLFIDLDDFKTVNDTHGHDVGDTVLVEVARRILAHSRGQDTVVRLGGDEFVVLCEGVTAGIAEAVAARIVEAIAEPVRVAGRDIRVTASCGVVVAGEETPRTRLLEAADAAMYRAKRAGRNRIAS